MSLWALAGLVFTLSQVFAAHGLGMAMNYWLWSVGFAGVTTLVARYVRSAVGVLILHGGFALLLNLIPQAGPLGMLRAGYDLLINH